MSQALSQNPMTGEEIKDSWYTTYPVLAGLYSLHDELGSGAFGKVRLATHLLTSQKVAIKIIDKNKIKEEDKHRMTTELDALMTLSHQNICRLYQYIDTPSKLFIIMEYCSGGEMFDYVVKKERLEESEARYFFRQLVQAVAYIHHMGYAHRDLKPENLLLTEDLQLKLIDFGLCARPSKPGLGLPELLCTFCGSLAYAAPELIEGLPYKGPQADMWSMGVLLYTLLCGRLPFDNSSHKMLFSQIKTGKYFVPDYLSPLSKDLLRSLLQVDPEKRISIADIVVHPWINKEHAHALRWRSIYDENIVDEDVISELAIHFQKPFCEIEALVKECRFDYLTATYHLLLQQKKRGMNFVLPMPKPKDGTADPKQTVLGSMTIHASLDNDLDSSGLNDIDFTVSETGHKISLEGSTAVTVASQHDKTDSKQPGLLTIDNSSLSECTDLEVEEANDPKILLGDGDGSTIPPSQYDKNLSYAYAVLNMPSTHTGISPKQRLACGIHRDNESTRNYSIYTTPIRPRINNLPSKHDIGFDSRFYRRGIDKENWHAATVRVRSTAKFLDDLSRSNLSATPSRNVPAFPLSLKMRSRSAERTLPTTPTRDAARVPINDSARTPTRNSTCTPVRSPAADNLRLARSSSKTPRLRQRVFASLERQADRMINFLTPRKIKDEEPEVLKKSKTMVNVSITSSKDPERVRYELIRVFAEQKLSIQNHGWKISGQKKESNHVMTVELEVVWIVMGCERLVGVKRKRLNGDAFLYKKVCEQILKLANL